MIRRGVRNALVVALGAALLATLLPGAGQTATSMCAQSKPDGMKFERKRGLRYGRLSWHAKANGSRFRVFRNGVVIGQTKRRSMPVRVKPGRLYAFAVRMVRPSGVMANCVGILQQRVRWFPPAKIRKPVVRRTGEAKVRLRWRAARRGDARLAGYRVYRDGHVHRQVRRRTARLRLPTGATYRIEVAGVDTRGRVGHRSRAVLVSIGHRPPGPPGNIVIDRVADTEVGLSWGPAGGGSARVVGYRVFRDGAPVRQTATPSIVVGNLAPYTDYGFTVAAVDGRGYLGPATPVAALKTALPPPSDGKVHAFMLASTDESFETLQRNYRRIGVLYPTYFQCKHNTGSVAGKDDPLVTNWAKLRRIPVMPRFNCQHPATLHLILTNANAREASMQGIQALARQYGYEGINLDFEAGYEADREALTAYARTLGRRLHAEGRKLSLEVSAKWEGFSTSRNRFYDYEDLGEVADYVFVMNWGYHWSASGPGSPDPLPNVRQAADYTATMPRKSRYVLGSPLYGMDWPAGGGPSHPATALHHDEVMQLVARYGGRPRLDATAHSWQYKYTDTAGVPHEVWFNDRSTLPARMNIAKVRGLGFGVWRLGQEDERVWETPILAPTNWP